jgi:hypothetical protein
MKIHAVNRFGQSPLNDAPAKMQAAFSSPEMRTVLPILNKIKTELSFSDFPMSIAELDSLLSGAGLKTSERIALKAAMSRAGLLK